MWDDIALEVAIIERLARENVRQKIASQQLGEAWVDLGVGDAEPVREGALQPEPFDPALVRAA